MNQEDALLLEIRELVCWQSKLVSAFFSMFPEIESVGQAPWNGVIEVDGELWLFKRHGAGAMFVNGHAVQVDVHKHFDSPECFDTWRLETFLYSQRKTDDYGEVDTLASRISRMVRDGRILKGPESSYKLA